MVLNKLRIPVNFWTAVENRSVSHFSDLTERPWSSEPSQRTSTRSLTNLFPRVKACDPVTWSQRNPTLPRPLCRPLLQKGMLLLSSCAHCLSLLGRRLLQSLGLAMAGVSVLQCACLGQWLVWTWCWAGAGQSEKKKVPKSREDVQSKKKHLFVRGAGFGKGRHGHLRSVPSQIASHLKKSVKSATVCYGSEIVAMP